MEKKKKEISIDKTVRKMLIWSIVASVLFVVGIPMTIIFAADGLYGVMAIGIAFIVFGFYGSPMLWIGYANAKTLKRVVDAVNEENLTTTEEIASQLQMRERDVRGHITKAINKKYITGFLFNGTTLTPNEKMPPKKKKVVENKCKNCGGPLEVTETGYICSYCGSKFDRE